MQLKPVTSRSSFKNPTQEQITRVRKRLAEMKKPAAIGALDPDNYSDYIPEAAKNPPPPSFKNLFRKHLSQATYETVVNVCKDAIPSLSINKDQCAIIENLTRQQRESKFWSTYRVGRISGSTFQQAISANVEKPPYSLIKKICYPAASGLTLVSYRTLFIVNVILQTEYLNI